MSKEHHSAYDETTTARCERALVTLLGDLGPWRERVYLVGGLVPRYLCGRLPEGARPHVGTTDVDLVIGLTLGDETPETYRTLQKNMEKAQFLQIKPSFRWRRKVEGVSVVIEFLCETDEVAPGRTYRPKGEKTGSKLSALNVRGAHLVRDDFVEHKLEAERLDGGGVSRVAVRVAALLPYIVLKIFAFQERHEHKDAYDLLFTVLNFNGDAHDAGQVAAGSPIAEHTQVAEAVTLLQERFSDAAQDGPSAYGLFLGEPGDEEGRARLRQEAVAAVRAFVRGFRDAPHTGHRRYP